MRIRTGNRRKLRVGRHDPVRCARHGLPYRGNGWVYAGGLRFAAFECPRQTCKNFKLLLDGAECEILSAVDLKPRRSLGVSS